MTEECRAHSLRQPFAMSELSDSPSVVSRWHELSREAEMLLRRNEELMAQRVALYHRHVDLFRDFVNTVQLFVHDVGTFAHHIDETSTGTVESSRRSR